MTAIKHLNIEVTRRCNQRCFYCFNNSAPDQSDTPLSVNDWCRTLRVLQKNGLQSTHITGGEPFLWSGTIQLLCSAQAAGLATSILSNGYHIPQLIRENEDVFRSLTVAQISLDSLDAQANNRRRGIVNAHRWALDAVGALRAIDVPVEISCVVDESNATDLCQLATACQAWECSLLLRPLLRCGRAAAEPAGCEQSVLRAVEAIAGSYPTLCVRDRFRYLPDEGNTEATLYGSYTVDPSGILRQQASLGPMNVNSLRDVA